MKVNDILRGESGTLYTVQRSEVMEEDGKEYLLLYVVGKGDLLIAYYQNGAIHIIKDVEKRNKIAKAFDEIAEKRKISG